MITDGLGSAHVLALLTILGISNTVLIMEVERALLVLLDHNNDRGHYLYGGGGGGVSLGSMHLFTVPGLVAFNHKWTP